MTIPTKPPLHIGPDGVRARHSVKVGSTLYCSWQCAKEGRAIVAEGREITEAEYTTEAYGALCPTCVEPYPEF